MTTTHPAGFTGFPPEGIAFLRQLEAHNDRAWFDAHRDTYVDAVREPAKALVVDLGDALRRRGLVDVRAEPKVGRSLFRINRDTRFAADTTPYHPHLDVVVWEGPDPRRSPAFLLRMTGTEVTVGAGVIHLRDERLERFRAAVAEDTSGAELAGILEQLAAAPAVQLATPSRQRVPAGSDPSHPRAELLKLDALHATTTQPLPAAVTHGRFVDWIADRQLAYAPLHRWLVTHLEETT